MWDVFHYSKFKIRPRSFYELLSPQYLKKKNKDLPSLQRGKWATRKTTRKKIKKLMKSKLSKKKMIKRLMLMPMLMPKAMTNKDSLIANMQTSHEPLLLIEEKNKLSIVVKCWDVYVEYLSSHIGLLGCLASQLIHFLVLTSAYSLKFISFHHFTFLTKFGLFSLLDQIWAFFRFLTNLFNFEFFWILRKFW